MLTQLDTAIAFVVVMLMLSLLVTAIVQMISALMDLRGKNLVRALTSLLQQLDQSLKAGGYNVSPLAQFWYNLKNRTSEGVSRAKQLAQAVASHPTIAHSGALAKAVRKDELLDVLKDLASPETLGNISAGLQKDLGALLTGTRDFEQALMAKLGAGFPGLPDIRAALESLARELVEDPAAGGAAAADFAKNLLAKLPPELTGLPQVQSAVAAASARLSRAGAGIAKLETGLDRWFDTVMDRASDVFTRWTRVVTVAISVLLVVILQIDAGQILDQLSANADLRAALVKLSDSAQRQASDTFARATVAMQAAQSVAKLHTGDSVASDLPAKAETYARAEAFSNCSQGDVFIRAYILPKDSKAEKDQLSGEFEGACRTMANVNFDAARDSIGKTKDELKATGLRLIPETAFRKDDKGLCARVRTWSKSYQNDTPHLLGTLAMVILLSLGAPFWFNALRQLSNLKPTISQKVEGEEKPDAQNSQGGGAAPNRGA